MTKFTLEDCLMFTTNTSSKLFKAVLTDRLKDVGVTNTTWISLYFINSHDIIFQNNLAKLVGITGPSMVKIVQRLDDEGLIYQQQDSKDHRKKLISLTEDGIKKYNEILSIVIEFQKTMTKGLSQKELDIVANVFDKMIRNAKKALS